MAPKSKKRAKMHPSPKALRAQSASCWLLVLVSNNCYSKATKSGVNFPNSRKRVRSQILEQRYMDPKFFESKTRLVQQMSNCYPIAFKGQKHSQLLSESNPITKSIQIHQLTVKLFEILAKQVPKSSTNPMSASAFQVQNGYNCYPIATNCYR